MIETHADDNKTIKYLFTLHLKILYLDSPCLLPVEERAGDVPDAPGPGEGVGGDGGGAAAQRHHALRVLGPRQHARRVHRQLQRRARAHDQRSEAAEMDKYLLLSRKIFTRMVSAPVPT